MAEAVTKFPAKTDIMGTQSRPWYPFEALRREVDRLVSEFDDWRGPVRRSLFDYVPFGRFETRGGLPAIDIEEKAGEYEITAELPGLDEKDVELKVANGVLTIRGEKKEQKEEKRRGFHLSERRFGTFERAFLLPEGVDAEAISASFKQGVLTVSLPKTRDAQTQEKKIAIRSA